MGLVHVKSGADKESKEAYNAGQEAEAKKGVGSGDKDGDDNFGVLFVLVGVEVTVHPYAVADHPDCLNQVVRRVDDAVARDDTALVSHAMRSVNTAAGHQKPSINSFQLKPQQSQVKQDESTSASLSQGPLCDLASCTAHTAAVVCAKDNSSTGDLEGICGGWHRSVVVPYIFLVSGSVRGAAGSAFPAMLRARARGGEGVPVPSDFH